VYESFIIEWLNEHSFDNLSTSIGIIESYKLNYFCSNLWQIGVTYWYFNNRLLGWKAECSLTGPPAFIRSQAQLVWLQFWTIPTIYKQNVQGSFAIIPIWAWWSLFVTPRTVSNVISCNWAQHCNSSLQSFSSVTAFNFNTK